ncbi:MAG: EpsI family protein [Gemmatimonadota bacterium]|nr:EpsI family protein [Gemmatimonadota bacterium]MDH5284684.1 EpsI family protein [Gemmatimonadota bacterium]
MRDWTAWVPGAILAAGSLLTLGVDRQRDVSLVRSLDSIPLVLAGRPGQAGTISQEQQEAAGMSSYLVRWYDGDVAPFEIYVGYYESQTQGRTIHSPKNCLPGSGWEALNQSETTVETPAGPRIVNRYLLQNKERRALVYYWYQGRGRVASNEYGVKWDLLRDAALHGRTEEALVRIVVHFSGNTDEAGAATWASRAAADLIPAVETALPAWP